MIVYLANKTQFREKPHGKGVQASCLFLPNEKTAGNEKATGKMPVLRYKIPSTGKIIDLTATLPIQHARETPGPDPNASRSHSSSVFLGDLPARHSPQDGGGCAFAVNNSFTATCGITFNFRKEQWLQDCQYAELPDHFTAKPGFFLAQVVGESMNRRIPNH